MNDRHFPALEPGRIAVTRDALHAWSRDDGELVSGPPTVTDLQPGNALILYGSDHGHDAREASR